jgi:hypothetical protein
VGGLHLGLELLDSLALPHYALVKWFAHLIVDKAYDFIDCLVQFGVDEIDVSI